MSTVSSPITTSALSITTGTSNTATIKEDESEATLTFARGLPAQEVDRRAQAARTLQGKAHHLLAHWLFEVEERKLHFELGYSSVYHYGEISLQLEGHTVAEYLRTARALRNFPLLSDAYQNGLLSASKLREITRVVEKDTERHWLERALTHTTRQIEKMVVFSPRQSRTNPNTLHGGSAAHPVSPTTGLTKNPTVGLMGHQSHPSITPHMDCPSAHSAEGSEGRGFPPDTTRTIEDTPVLMCCRENLEGPHTPHDVDFHETQPLPGIPPRKYLEKMVLELSGEQAAIVHDAFRKARKESGLSDRASLVTYMARAFMDGVQVSRDRHSTKPAYQVVFHHQSGVSWVESERGPVYVADTMCEKALCDAEIVEVEAVPDDCRHDCAECDKDKETQSPGEEQISGEGLVRSILPSASGQARDIESDCVSPGESVNRLFQLYREKAREGSESGTEKPRTKSTPVKNSTRTIPLSLRKKVLLRDGGRCQAPGCGRNRFVEVHHVRAIGAGGSHALPNVVVLCGSCHALVHEGRLSIEGEASGRLRWRRVQG